jgi:hypothetical protein
MANNGYASDCTDMCSPVRNRYFYGKLLDVFHFELEQTYLNNKRWLLNRLVSGYGVICGLNVKLGSDGQSVVVTPGVAIDKCGREIIVCQPSDPYTLPPPAATPTAGASAPGASPTSTTKGPGVAPTGTTASPPAGTQTAGSDCTDTGVYKHLCVCYHECLTDPSPALGGDCDTQASCAPGSIREKYCLKLCDGKLCPAPTTSPLQSVISGGALNYSMLATYVANLQCFNPGEDCCIPLANVQIPAQGQSYSQNSFDISIRPLVYTVDMLYDLMLASMNQGQTQLRGGK